MNLYLKIYLWNAELGVTGTRKQITLSICTFTAATSPHHLFSKLENSKIPLNIIHLTLNVLDSVAVCDSQSRMIEERMMIEVR